jgi:hypothetical protein
MFAARSTGFPDETEEKLGQLKTRLAVAEYSVAADIAAAISDVRSRRIAISRAACAGTCCYR